MDTAGAIQDAHSGLHAADADARSRCDAGCNGGSTQDAHRRCGAERAQPRTAPHTPAAPLRLRGGAARRGRARGCGSRCWRRRRRRRGGLRPCPAHGPAPGAPRGPALLRGAEHGAAAGAAAGRAPAAARRPPQQEGRAGPGCGAMRCDGRSAPLTARRRSSRRCSGSGRSGWRPTARWPGTTWRCGRGWRTGRRPWPSNTRSCARCARRAGPNCGAWVSAERRQRAELPGGGSARRAGRGDPGRGGGGGFPAAPRCPRTEAYLEECGPQRALGRLRAALDASEAEAEVSGCEAEAGESPAPCPALGGAPRGFGGTSPVQRSA